MPPHRTRLLAEQVGLGLLGEGRLEDAGAGAAERPGIGEDALAGRAGGVAMDREQRRNAAARLVDAAKQVAGTLRGDHPDVDVARRVDPPEVDVEAVGEHDELAGPEVRRDLGVVDGLLAGVGDEDHHGVRGLDRVGHVGDPQARLLGQRPALRPGRQPDDHLDPRLVEVQRMGMALRPVADDRNRLPAQRRRVRIVVVVHARGHCCGPSEVAASTFIGVRLPVRQPDQRTNEDPLHRPAGPLAGPSDERSPESGPIRPSQPLVGPPAGPGAGGRGRDVRAVIA